MTALEKEGRPGPVLLKPRNEQIDFYGLTHTGKVRKENQDHFLICSLRKHLDVAMTSLPDPAGILQEMDRLAFFAMVADSSFNNRVASSYLSVRGGRIASPRHSSCSAAGPRRMRA